MNVKYFLAAIVMSSALYSWSADSGVQLGAEDDFTALGQEGTITDPDVELQGFTAFGTNYSAAQTVTSGVGNAFVQNNFEVGSNVYVAGDLSLIKNVSYSWPTNQGDANTVLKNDGSGGLSWVAPNLIPQDLMFFSDAAATRWNNQPAAATEFRGATQDRHKMDLSNATMARILVYVAVAGATDSKLSVQYSTNQTTWVFLSGSSSTGPVASLATAELSVSSWTNITDDAKQDVFLRIVGVDGNGTADPRFGRISVQFK